MVFCLSFFTLSNLNNEVVQLATGYTGGWNVSNVDPVINDVKVYCEDIGGESGKCDNSGNDKLWFDTITSYIVDNNGQDIPLTGGEILVNDTTNASYLKYLVSATDFTLRYNTGSDYYFYNTSYTIPNGFEAGWHYIQTNITDNQSALVKDWGDETNGKVYIYDYDPLTEQLLASDGTDEDISAGAWGNMTADPGDTNAASVNYIRIKNVGGAASQDFTLDFTPSTWSKGGDSVDIDTNIGFRWILTNTSTDNPGNNFVTEGSNWSLWYDSDSDGSITLTFYTTDEYQWIQFRVNAVPTPAPYGRYTAAFTITAL
jgi:hypothetical protein